MKSLITIGRSNCCDIIVPDSNISRVHSRISIVNGQYVYEDVGKNGSVIYGQIISGSKITIEPGCEILLAGKIPLPWEKVYALLPLKGSNPFNTETNINKPHYHVPIQNINGKNQVERLSAIYAIISFCIPIVGWILYFAWKEDEHSKAIQASNLAWIGFLVNIFLSLMLI